MVVKIFDSAVKMVQLYRGGCVVLRSVFLYMRVKYKIISIVE